MGILSKIFGDPNEKYLKKLQPTIEKINLLEPETEKLSDLTPVTFSLEIIEIEYR